jgi:serine/threonine protein kinase
MIGGEYKGQGASGCGFYPGFRCKDDLFRDKNIFTKLMTKEGAEHELEIVRHIKKIDPDMKYSIYPYKMCFPSEDDVDDLMKEGLAKCSLEGNQLDNPLTVKLGFQKRILALLQQKYGGVSLESIIYYARNNNVTVQTAYKVLYQVSNLFKGLAHYHNNNVVHLDCKPDNIVVNNKTSFFIDFGLSIELKTYEPGNKMFDIEFPFYSKKLYEFYPFDSIYIKKWKTLFNDRGDIIINKQSLHTYWNQLKEFPYIPIQLYTGEYYDGEFIPFSDEREFYEMYESIFNNLLKLNDGNKKVLKKTIRDYIIKQVDVYSLGFTLCKLTYALSRKILNADGKIVKAKGFTVSSSLRDDIVEELYRLGIKMMLPDPLARISSPAALQQYITILKMIPLSKSSPTSSNKMIESLEKSSDGFDPYLILQSLLEI